METFRALLVEESAPGQFTRSVVERSIEQLPPGEVLVQVQYSSLNYKDALSASGNRGVTRVYPHTPGIDAAGVVVVSNSAQYGAGDEVIVQSPELGTSIPGGFGQYVRVNSPALVHRPEGLSLRDCMAYGVAGFTAGMMIEKLEKFSLTAGSGDVLVTGATGGVGCIGVAILSLMGYHVVAATRKMDQVEFLHQLGAADVVNSDLLDDTSGRALLSGRWAGVFDTVGGNILATGIRSTRPGGVVAACGNAMSADLHLTVYPFILRGVSLVGVDATQMDAAQRVRLWEKLATTWRPPHLQRIACEISLDNLDTEIETILRGGQVGRVIVNLSA